MPDELENLIVEIGPMDLPTDVVATLAGYARLVERWNERIQLTATRDPMLFCRRHLADGLHLCRWLAGDVGTLLDVGCGGGVPGLVVAIVRPGCRVTALEPVHKKAAFLRSARRELGVKNFFVRSERDEEHQDAGYDVAVSRATFSVTEWLERGARFVRPHGCLVAFEGSQRVIAQQGDTRHLYQLDGERHRALLFRVVA